MRLSLLVGAAAVHPGLNRCEQLLQLPRIVVNQDSKPERLAYMKAVWGEDIIRVRGVDGTDDDEMRSYFGKNIGPDESVDDAAKRFFHASRGEVACTVAHIHAMQKARELKLETFVVLEDDASPQLCAFWPMPISEIIKQVEREDPEWELIRLQWHIQPERLHRAYETHLNAIKEMNKAVPNNKLFAEMQATIGNWSEHSVPMTARCVEPLWGGSSSIWSRRGYERVLAYNAKAPNNATCHPTCYVGTAVYGQSMPNHCFMTLPPYLGVRIVEEGSTIRQKKEHHKHHCMHQRQTFTSLHWFMSLSEIFLPVSADQLPETEVDIAHMCGED